MDWAGGPAEFCARTGINRSNLNAYLNATKPIAWQRLETATEQVFRTQPSNVEYLEQLVEWAGGAAQFCKLTGILRSNLTAYFNETKPVSWTRLQRATEQVFAIPPAFVPVVEGHDLTASRSLTVLPTVGGLYALFDSAMRLLYYGKATNLRAEVAQTLRRRVGEVKPWTGSRKLTFKDLTVYLSAYRIIRGDNDFRHDVEALGLRLLVNNTYNRNHGSFKRSA